MDFKEFMINEYGEPLTEVEARCAAVDRNIAALKSREAGMSKAAESVTPLMEVSGSTPVHCPDCQWRGTFGETFRHLETDQYVNLTEAMPPGFYELACPSCRGKAFEWETGVPVLNQALLCQAVNSE